MYVFYVTYVGYITYIIYIHYFTLLMLVLLLTLLNCSLRSLHCICRYSLHIRTLLLHRYSLYLCSTVTTFICVGKSKSVRTYYVIICRLLSTHLRCYTYALSRYFALCIHHLLHSLRLHLRLRLHFVTFMWLACITQLRPSYNNAILYSRSCIYSCAFHLYLDSIDLSVNQYNRLDHSHSHLSNSLPHF